MLLHVLGHVDADHRPLVVEEELGQRAGQLGLADARRPEEEERPDGTVGVAQPGAAAPDGVGHGGDRLVLPHHALVEGGLQPHQLLHLALQEARDGDAGPAADHLGDVLGVDLLLQEARAGLQLGQVVVGVGDAAFQLRQLAVADGRRAGQVGVALQPGRLLLLERLLLLQLATALR